MGEVERFRREKRLKSLDEIDGPIWRWDTLPEKRISPILIALAGLALGIGIGTAIVLL